MKSHFLEFYKEEIVVSITFSLIIIKNIMVTINLIDEMLAFLNKSFDALYNQVKDIMKNFANKIYIL